MSVVSCNEIWSGRQGSVDQQVLRRYIRVFQVVTNDPNDDAGVVGGATGIPALFSPYSTPNYSDPQSRLTDIRPYQSTESPKVWEVTCEYTGRTNPLTDPPVIQWGSDTDQRIAELDINGQAVLNSAGQFFDPPPEVDHDLPTLTITRNEATVSPANIIAYQNAINTDSLSIAGLAVTPGQAKIKITSTSQSDDSLAWWQTVYTIQFERDGWARKILDQGRYQVSGSGGGLTPCVDKDGNAVDDPVPLDGHGKQLADPSPLTAVYLTFDLKKELSFAALGLPT